MSDEGVQVLRAQRADPVPERAERLLVDVVKLPWHQVHEEAGRLEHAISGNLERHLVELLGDPGTCPHGNPIPGSTHPAAHGPLRAVSELVAGEPAVVRRIDEQIEAQPSTMRMLEDAALMPGRRVSARQVDDGKTTVETDSGVATLPLVIAEKVYVSRE
jgi:DtxR family Mn-dependent transcriptional regulator